VTADHVYADPDEPKCPICRGGLWGNSRWANRQEIESLGWAAAIDARLDTPGEDR
jgi:hypothetical protein